MGRTLLVQSEETLLHTIAEGVEAETGAAFFHSLVRHLATALGVTHSFISELTQGGTHFRTLAVWANGASAPNFEVPLDGTPCESVLRGEPAFYCDHVQERFPRDTGLADWSAVSYAGTPMFDSTGTVVGHVAFFHDKVFEDEGPALAVMRIFAKRVVAEIERLRLEDSLRAAQERLSRVVASATDAIISFDQEGQIQLFNSGAERVLRCPSNEAIGAQIERFTTRDGRAALRSAVEQLDSDPAALFFVGGAEPLQAQRADGELFGFESSLSRTEIDGQPVYTLILRDVDERQKSEQELTLLRRQAEYLREEIAETQGFESIVGSSSALRQALDEVKLVARTDTSVLVRGATGTGKELLARAVHACSRRAERPLIKVNCAAIPAGLVESELFGHEKGAFTGAMERRIGRFELADGGTLFLDEVGELPLEAQVKLLRVLQEREFERVGGSQTIRVDVRIVAATNRDLEQAVAKGTFREDLYYRLSVFPVVLPPLCQRTEDIPLLANLFIQRHATRIGRRVTGLSEQARRRLMEYPWPGNVRELENVVERALILGQGSLLEIPPQLLAIPAGLAAGSAETSKAPGPSLTRASVSLEDVERSHIRGVLEATCWRIEGREGAAARLGLAPSTLRSRMRKLGIQRSALS